MFDDGACRSVADPATGGISWTQLGMALALLWSLAGCGEPQPFRHDVGDLSAADRIEVTVEGVTPVGTITDRRRVEAVAAFVERRQDGWINVWSGAGGARYMTFYAGGRSLKGFGLSVAGISDGDYARPLSIAETAELAALLEIEWPPPRTTRRP